MPIIAINPRCQIQTPGKRPAGSKSISNQINRRSFLKIAAFLSAVSGWSLLGAEPAWTADWREAFRPAGFDPAAEGSSVFVVCGDAHDPEYSQHLLRQIDEWNAMRPAPRFVALLGDNGCSVSRSFGDTPDAQGLTRARKELEGLREKLMSLRPEIPLKLVIGNHDTLPGEVDATFFRTVFPDCPPYQTFEDSGIRFMIWNGGHDGGIDARQRTWIKAQCAALPAGQTAVVLVHQPSLGMTERERGIPAAVCSGFSAHTGPLWLLAGHEHSNNTVVFALPKTKIVQITHVKSVAGYWIYGMREGRIAARVFCDMEQGFRGEALPDRSNPARPIPRPFEGREDVVWSLLIGDDPEATKAAFVSGKGGDCGTWWFYVDELVYRLPLAERGNGATRFAVLAALSKHGKTGEPVHVFASADGAVWTETPLEETRAAVNLFVIPEALRGAKELFVKVKSYGLGANTCVGGFALCR
ncbi:MAG: metallophosphoesterase [Verrucomicrobiae bacterium]